MDLFGTPRAERPGGEPPRASAPLAERMRPATFDDVLGQDELVGPSGALRALSAGGKLPSLLLWGPPGSGKTTIARLLAGVSGLRFVAFSAVTSGVKEVREVVEGARAQRGLTGRGTLLFVDEIHRFNRAQQDAFLPHVEDGTIVLVGATTENPSFEVNAALLSRCRVFVLRPLEEAAIERVLARAVADRDRGLGSAPPRVEPGALARIAQLSGGDARVALTLLEVACDLGAQVEPNAPALTVEGVVRAAQRRVLRYDSSGEEHFNCISAFHKSLRGSDADAALYWMARMFEAGEDRLWVARRLVRFASEDVGLADPQAVAIAVAAKEAFEFLGTPEGELALAQAAVYLATAPKSNRVTLGWGRALEEVRRTGHLPVPLHLRNPVTDLMRELGYGKDYKYAHDFPDAIVAQSHRPEGVTGVYYDPGPFGFEKEVRKRLDWWRERLRRRGEGTES